MSDEEVTDTEDAEAPAEETSDKAERRNGHGPGLRLGLLLGAAVGAAVATLLARGEASAGPAQDGQASLIDQARAILHALRGRAREAAEEGHEAAREKEAELMSRYDELTR